MKLFTTVICLLLITGCKSGKTDSGIASGQVQYLNSDGRNSVTLSSNEIGNNDKEAVFNAKKQAFQNLFFRGLVSSPFSSPLIGTNEEKGYLDHRAYLDDFYTNRMESFITSSSEEIQRIKGGKRQANVRMNINIKALRKDLEDRGVIQKFGL